MKTKSLSSAWWKITLALVAIIPCLFIFTACGGEPIEQDEAFTALSSATNAQQYTDVQDFTVNGMMRYTTSGGDTNFDSNINTRLSYYGSGDQPIASYDASGTVTGGLGTAFGVDMTVNLDVSYKVADFGGTYYMINEEFQKKQTMTALDFLDYSFASVVLGSVYVVTADDLVENEVKSSTTDLVKVGENSYNLNFITTAKATFNNVTTTIERRYYYEIRDGNLTKFISEYSKTDGTETNSSYMECNISYSANATSIPTAADVDDYEETVFGDLSDVMPT